MLFQTISVQNYYYHLIYQREKRILNTILNRYINKGDIVFDIGAYTGMWTIAIAKKIGSEGKEYAFEPDYESYIGLIQNLKLNKILNVTPFN
ncbi:unnamed protein product, partial [marine sediment metagenome]